MTDANILEVDATRWRTPVTGLEGEVGGARFAMTTYEEGEYYGLEGVDGFYAYHVTGAPLPVQQLQRLEDGRWRTWMVDDPLHWLGMAERVRALPPGRIMVAGLGLGLFAHHLAAERSDVRATVLEIDPDVIRLMSPTLPAGTEVVHGDFYDALRLSVIMEEPPDAILWDLAVGDQHETGVQLLEGMLRIRALLPDTPVWQFGVRPPKRNVLEGKLVAAENRP